MSDKLKPCPFCGGTDLKSGGDDKIVGTWCLTCEASGPNQYGKIEWNTRAQPEAVTPSELASRIQRALIAEGVHVSPSVRIKCILPHVGGVKPEAVHTFCHNNECDKRDSFPVGPCPKCGEENKQEAVRLPDLEMSGGVTRTATNAGDVCKQVCDDNLLRFYISELKKTHTLVDNLVMTLKDCHPHISNDSIRARVGNMIVYADKFKKEEK